MEFVIGLVLGGLLIAAIFYYYRSSFTKHKSKEESVVLIEKIRNVSKMITVEGDFSEIMHFEDAKDVFLSLISSKKKAIVVANAKVLIGFDMRKIEIVSDPVRKKIHLKHFPEPEVLGIETDLQYYDVKNGLFNKFAAKDLTELNKRVKQNIQAKVPESDLLISANQKALETVQMIDQLVNTFGWKLSFDELLLLPNQQKTITDGNTK